VSHRRETHSEPELKLVDLLALPVTVDVTTAARALGLGRSTAYELARRNEFPCRVLRVGSSYRIPTADLLRVLGIEPPTWPVMGTNRQRSPRAGPSRAVLPDESGVHAQGA
jgi:excisionase family DNA binding protein